MDNSPVYQTDASNIVEIRAGIRDATAAASTYSVHGGGSGDGNGGDGVKPLWQLDVSRDVQIVKWGFVVLVGAFGAAWMFFLDRIDERFDRVDQPLREVQMAVSGQAEAMKAQAETLGRINDGLVRIDDRLNARHDQSQQSLQTQ